MEATDKEKLTAAQTWIRSLSPEQMMQETAKAKKLCLEHQLISPQLKRSIMHNGKLEIGQRIHRLALAMMTEAYIYRQGHSEQ